MRPFWADPASPAQLARIHPALTSAADEVYAIISRLLAYVGTLALIAMLGVHFWDELPQMIDDGAWSGGSRADRSPAVAGSAPDQSGKSGAYTIPHDPEGAGKDASFSWAGQADRPIRRIPIDRTGPKGAARSGDWITEAAHPRLRGPL